MQPIIVAIHGILTAQTNPSWPDQFDAWMSREHASARVLKKEYFAGPFPRWNCWVRNPRLSRGLAAEVALLLKDNRQAPLWIVAHSNGAWIALEAVRRLVRQGFAIRGIILIGAACNADVDQNGILRWIESGRLGVAIAYSSIGDHVLPGSPSRPWSWLYRLLAWPYGSLGRTGWTRRGRQLIEPATSLPGSASPRVLTRWFPGGHSDYFKPARIDSTFRQIARDIEVHSAGPANSPASATDAAPQSPAKPAPHQVLSNGALMLPGLLAQVPAVPRGAIENWLLSAAAVGSLFLLGRKLFSKPPGSAFVTRTEFDSFRQRTQLEVDSIRDRLDARFLALAEKVEQLRVDLLKDAERRCDCLHARLNDLQSSLARVDERTRD